MNTELFDYELPEERIAQTPAQRRDRSRLMRVERSSRTVSHHFFAELPDLLPAGTRLFRNNASVLKARLMARRPSGGSVECLLLRPCREDARRWWCLLRPGRRLQAGAQFGIPGHFSATVLNKSTEAEYEVHFDLENCANVVELTEQLGSMPLPAYIRRESQDSRTTEDQERYQTVYADPDRKVAAAAPTAGLHFTPELLDRMAAGGFSFHDLTLHVGLGTFRPISSSTIEAHTMHREFYEIPPSTLSALQTAGSPRLAVGTTSLRAIEHWHRNGSSPVSPPASFTAEADLYIYPPATFYMDALVTNFHLPRSTLLCLLAAFLAPECSEGIEWFKELYAEALAHDYRFFSYGDAMLIL